MVLAARTSGRGQLVIGAPGQEPRLHVLVLDLVARFDLAIRLADFGQHPLLVGNIGLHGIGNQKVRASTRGLREPR